MSCLQTTTSVSHSLHAQEYRTLSVRGDLTVKRNDKQTERARSRTPRPKSPRQPKPPSRSISGTRLNIKSRASSKDSAYSNKFTRRNATTESYPSQMREIQKHSSFSRSANKDKATSVIPSTYRTKSPSTQAALRRHYFTPGDKCEELKNWRDEKRCLRCFSHLHTARNCHVHRTPAKEPCKMCVYLFHDTHSCTRYSLDGKLKHKKSYTRPVKVLEIIL
jgi:hypothetical protein